MVSYSSLLNVLQFCRLKYPISPGGMIPLDNPLVGSKKFPGIHPTILTLSQVMLVTSYKTFIFGLTSQTEELLRIRWRTFRETRPVPGASDSAVTGKQTALVFFRIPLAEAFTTQRSSVGSQAGLSKTERIFRVINMLAILENVRISGHYQFIIIKAIQVRLKRRILVTNFSNQNNKDKIIPNMLFYIT